MQFNQLKEATPQDVRQWIENNIPELTNYQKQEIVDEEIGRWTDELVFFKYKQSKKVKFWWRLTVIFFPFAWAMLFIGLPFNMILTGKWGYHKKFVGKFWSSWMEKLELNF